MWIYPVIKRVGLGLGLEDGSKTSCLCYPEAIVVLMGKGIVPSESFSLASLEFYWSRLRPRRRSFLFSANWISASWGWATALNLMVLSLWCLLGRGHAEFPSPKSSMNLRIVARVSVPSCLSMAEVVPEPSQAKSFWIPSGETKENEWKVDPNWKPYLSSGFSIFLLPYVVFSITTLNIEYWWLNLIICIFLPRAWKITICTSADHLYPLVI